MASLQPLELPILGSLPRPHSGSARRCLVSMPRPAQLNHLQRRQGGARSRCTGMSITLNLNRLWGFHVVRFDDRVTIDQLVKLARMHQSLPSFAAADAIHIIDESADLSALSFEHVDTLREHYAKLHRSIDFYVVRRAAWVCASAQACRIVEYWLKDRHSRDGQGTEVCLAANLAQTSPLFSQEEVEAVEQWSDFTELARIESQSFRAFR